ncbi:hypothetical protein Clacol_009941 [Clathrus columnatus]|uniref:Solute carrier family 40 protein n=1 Tax=Clathrus columnatus TaxID=1419009 RepID=A0AAV5AQ82_9AGAM|nr:hypothetical protein Clacol_009941 [Clathrus columnatus]
MVTAGQAAMVVDSERTPLLDSNETPGEEGPHPQIRAGLDRTGLRCLLIQHFSSAWNDRSAEFALYLYLIVHFKDTLLPSSLLGFSMTVTGVTLSRYAGSLIDKYPKLSIIRFLIASQKISSIVAYSCCAMIIAFESTPSVFGFMTPQFICLLLSACLLHFSNIAVSIAVERDWASCIGKSSPDSNGDDQLSRLNTYLRQINLLCKLCAPLFVSMLTVKLDAPSSFSFSNLYVRTGLESLRSIWVLISVTALSLIFELYWIEVVYRRFPSLALDQARKDAELAARRANIPTVDQTSSESMAVSVSMSNRIQGMCTYVAGVLNLPDWKEMVRLPIFFSSASIALLYLTVLSFDGIMISYLKTLSYSDNFIAEMRGISVILGLLGTAVAAPLERKIGSVRAGNWSIWSMVFCLVPVIISFYIPARTTKAFVEPRSTLGILGGILLFGGMAFSRIGLWSFDLIQTKQLQNALLTHPRRNTLTGLQYTMQNVMNLMKYILTMVLYRPSQFHWAAIVSFGSVSTAAMTYMVYVKKERGHITHIPIKLDWVLPIYNWHIPCDFVLHSYIVCKSIISHNNSVHKERPSNHMINYNHRRQVRMIYLGLPDSSHIYTKAGSVTVVSATKQNINLNMYANTEQPNAQLDHLRNELPTHESASDANFKPTHGGVGSLPGGRDESGVAMLPDERTQGNTGQGYMGSQSQTVPGTAEPISQQDNHQPYDTPRMQEVSKQQDTTDSSVPGVSNQPPSTAQQTEGQGHHRKPSLGQRMKQSIKNMTSDIKKT